MNHSSPNLTKEYLKFVLIMLAVSIITVIHASILGFSLMQFMSSFMGVFFVVFAGFKLINFKEFAHGFQGYDLIAKRSLVYAYFYPFMQLSLGFIYLLGLDNNYVNGFVLLISLISGAGVLKSLHKKQQLHCVCLGNVIKLPLSTISFVEDFGMALMALAMILIH